MTLTWSCHICKEVRPDDKISVITHPFILNGQKVADQNVRYCNDKEDCIEKSKTFRFFEDR